MHAQQITQLEEEMSDEEQSVYSQYGDGFLRCRALTVGSSTLATMYSRKKDSMTISVLAHMWHKKTKISALLDNSATHNFIDKRTIKTLGLGTRTLLNP